MSNNIISLPGYKQIINVECDRCEVKSFNPTRKCMFCGSHKNDVNKAVYDFISEKYPNYSICRRYPYEFDGNKTIISFAAYNEDADDLQLFEVNGREHENYADIREKDRQLREWCNSESNVTLTCIPSYIFALYNSSKWNTIITQLHDLSIANID